MIRLNITLKRWRPLDTFTNFYSHTTQLSEHKSVEWEYIYSGQYLFELTLDLRWDGEDHAGPELELGVWGHEVRIKLYDHRHWNYENCRWYEPEEEWDNAAELEDKMFTIDETKIIKF